MNKTELTKEWLIQLRFMLKDAMEAYDEADSFGQVKESELAGLINTIENQIVNITAFLTNESGTRTE